MASPARVSKPLIWAIRALVPLVVAALAIGATPASGAASALDLEPVAAPPFTVVADPMEVRPGRSVRVSFLDDVK